MNYLQFDIETDNEAQGEMLIALLADAGFESFEQEGTRLKAYTPEAEFDEARLRAILDDHSLEFTRTVIPPENWNAKWESSFEPVRVNDFAAIRAAFHKPEEGVQHEIIITPKMSFGTGHHATTFLMIEQMSVLKMNGLHVLDLGTGTGVLAILAEKMGAEKITAIDNDEWSIENSNENIRSNGCSRISIALGETIPAGETYDVILANINLNVILANLSAIVGACKPGTLVLLSGFLKPDELTLFTAVARQGFSCTSISQKGDWVCLGMTIN